MSYIVWFKNINKTSIPVAGGKGANLGELVAAGLPVPPGFIITAQTYKKFIETSNIDEDIDDVLKDLDVEDNDQLQSASRTIQNIIKGTPMPEDMQFEIKSAYEKIPTTSNLIIAGFNNEPGEYVAVRSSATAEDLPGASFAGQQATFLNVKGGTAVVDAVRGCWASLFTARAIYYRVKKGFEHKKVLISVIIQQMVDSDKSGVMFTINPVNNDRTKISIDSAWGLGEAIVGGEVTPDHFLVDKEDLSIVEKSVARKKFMYTRDMGSGETRKVSLTDETGNKSSMSGDEVKKLAAFGKRIEEHYGYPQDIEWAVDGDTFYILQSRPVTTMGDSGTQGLGDSGEPSGQLEVVWKTGQEEKEKTQIAAQQTAEVQVPPQAQAKMQAQQQASKPVQQAEGVILTGFGASPGVGAGKVKIVSNVNELDKVQKGDVLVAKMTSPDMVPAMERAAAIVTDEGGVTCHAAIVSRELGIPCIVGTKTATQMLSDGQEITVDAKKGVVIAGIQIQIQEKPKAIENFEKIPTKTKIYVNLGIPSKANEVAALPVDGVGLMREEFIIASQIGEHPLAMIERGHAQIFIDKLAAGIQQVAQAFAPRPVVMRFSDFKTNEYKDLEGGEKFEEHEDNPMIGWRGCSRYISEKYVEAFRLELKAVKKVRDAGFKNLWVMLPFVRKLDDVTKSIELMKQEGLERGPDFKVWIMAEVPSVVVLADEFASMIDGFSIGSNDLTQLTMGADRDSETLQKLGYFDEMNEAVLRSIARLIKIGHAKGISVSICGQAPSTRPEIVKFLVEKGIDSISANPDVAAVTMNLVAQEESRITLANDENANNPAPQTQQLPQAPAAQQQEQGALHRFEKKVTNLFHHEKAGYQ